MPEFLTDDGVRIHYVIRGDGPCTVVYLHSMGGDCVNWRDLWGAMDPHRYRHVALDFRGHGCSTREPCEVNNERLSRDVMNLADALGIERFSVVGHSMGGKVGMKSAALAPDRVFALALLASTGPGFVPFKREDVAGFMSTYHDMAVTQAFFRPWFKVWPSPAVDGFVRSFAALPDWALHAAAEMAIWTDLTPSVHGLALPMLSVAGADDPVYGSAYQCEAVLSVFPHARLVTVPDCGHGMMLERPVEIAAHLQAFFDTLPV